MTWSRVCLTIPLGSSFQFCAGPEGLRVVAVTVPPWTGDPPGHARSAVLATPRLSVRSALAVLSGRG
jgi:hypothetical protein